MVIFGLPIDKNQSTTLTYTWTLGFGVYVYFSTGWSYSTCLQYHYVADQKTWTEAQTYCRQTYADLATIGNKEQNDQLLDTITSNGQSSEVWMGLYSTIDWRWSDGFSGVGANYSNWRHGQPNFHSAAEFCVLGGRWKFLSCEEKLPFVCYSILHGCVETHRHEPHTQTTN
uniref:C-type lectin domain-containing protein n=1 Tax=Gouania willdenowi TaxID=441366 RepID=A0A8C5G674_GOUWI